MTAWLASAVCLLSGAVLALWWRYKLARAQARIVGLEKDVTALDRDKRHLAEQLDAAMRREVRLVEEHAAECLRRDKQLEVYRETEEHLRALLRKYGDKPELVAERLGMLFPAPRG